MSTKSVIKILKKIADGEVKLDVCQLGSQLEEKVLKSKDSSSPSAVVFGKLISTTIDKDAEFEDINVAVKIFLDIHHISNIGLLYEVEVYKYILDEIILPGYCMNFVPFIGYGKCNIPDTTEIFPYFQQYDETFKEDYKEKLMAHPSAGVNVLMTERMKNSMNFHDFIMRQSEFSVATVLFQILYALTVMEKFRIMHNDLHFGNILIVEKEENVPMYFDIDGEKFSFETRFIPYIFDWDYGYVEPLGDNPRITKTLCGESGICNRYSPRYDLYILLCTLFYSIKKRGFNHLNNYLKQTYYTNLFQYIEHSKEKFHPVSDTFLKKIKEFHTDYGKSYKMSGLQLKSLDPNFFKTTGLPETITSLRFEVNFAKSYIRVDRGVRCRPIQFDSRYPTPMEMIKFEGEWTKGSSDIFREFRTKDEPKENSMVFTFPSEGVNKGQKIYINPQTISTRKQIQGKPRFPLKEKGGYIISPEKTEKITKLVNSTVEKAKQTEINMIMFEFPEKLETYERFQAIQEIYTLFINSRKKKADVLSMFNAIALFDVMVANSKFTRENYILLMFISYMLSQHVYGVPYGHRLEPEKVSELVRVNIRQIYSLRDFILKEYKFLYGTAVIYVWEMMVQNYQKINITDIEKLLFATVNLEAYKDGAEASAIRYMENPYLLTSKRPNYMDKHKNVQQWYWTTNK